MEPSANNIRKNHDFSGIKTGEDKHKIGMYAVNIILYLSDHVASLNELQKTLQEFNINLGLKLNYLKSEIYPITLNPNTRNKLHQEFVYTVNGLTQEFLYRWKYLGTHFPSDLTKLKVHKFGTLQHTLANYENTMARPLLKPFILPKNDFYFCSLK